MQIFNLINKGSEDLKSHNIISHRLDAELLLSKILNQSREKLIVNFDQLVSKEKIYKYTRLLRRRASREPIAYIFKKKEFWSKNFIISNNVLIPRPETELMVEKLSKIYENKTINVLDIGTGSGCILISLVSELKKARGIGIDISAKAIKIANKNLAKFRVKNKIKFFKKSLSDIYNCKFDLITSNPPYIFSREIKNLEEDIKNFEPKIALDGGKDGLDVVKKIIYKSKNILKIKGMLALEIGNEQFKQVSKLLKNNNFKIKYLIRDYQKNIRCVLSILQS
tara:strand:- start:2003 stop:2845 length:843 start_codon:yes stop_codon:yes gene_type:complete